MKMYKWNGNVTSYSNLDKFIPGSLYIFHRFADEQKDLIAFEGKTWYHWTSDFTEVDLIEDDDTER